MNLPIPTKKTGMALLTLTLVGLLALGFMVSPTVNSAQAASVITREVQGCTGSAQPPTLSIIPDALFSNGQSNGWTLDSFGVSSLSYVKASSLKISGLHLTATYYQSYPQWNFGPNGTETVSNVSVSRGDLTLSISSLDISRNTTTFSASMTGLNLLLHSDQNFTGTWTHTTVSASNADFTLVWSCTS